MTIVWGDGPSGRSASIVNEAVSSLDAIVLEVSPAVAAKIKEVNDSLKLLKEHYKTGK